MSVVTKLFSTQAKSIDDETKSVDFVISTNDVDRYGDVVDQKSWNFKSYQDNPIILWGHDPSEPENVLGTASNLRIAPDGSNTSATLTFATDINAKAALVFDLIKRGVLRTVSVGFRNHSLEYDEDTPILKDNELLEVSVVPIPANAGAVAKELKAANIHAKDAQWLMDSMRKEADLMEDTLKHTNGLEKKTMTEEQATAVLDGIAKLTTAVEELKTENATLKDEVAALKPPVETEEEKTAREAKEAEDAAAAQKAQEDANVAAGLNPDGSAKSGTDGDQGGAGDVEFDEDAELTPEQEAELDEQFASQMAELETAA